MDAIVESRLGHMIAHHLEGAFVHVDTDDRPPAQPRQLDRRRARAAADVQDAAGSGFRGRQHRVGPAGVLQERGPQLTNAELPVEFVGNGHRTMVVDSGASGPKRISP